MAQNNPLVLDDDVIKMIVLFEEMPNPMWFIVVAPDDIDVLALNASSVEFAFSDIILSLSEGEITEMPENVIFTDHSVDIVGDRIVHHVHGISGDSPVA